MDDDYNVIPGITHKGTSIMPVFAHSLLDELSWPYSIPEDRPSCAVFSITMSGGEIPVTIESLWESQIILIYLKFSVAAPEGRRKEVALLISRINNEIPLGAWHMSAPTGEIWYRISMHGGTNDDANQLDRHVELARKAFADWQKPISVVLSSDMPAEKAFNLKLLIDLESPENWVESISGRYRP